MNKEKIVHDINNQTRISKAFAQTLPSMAPPIQRPVKTIAQPPPMPPVEKKKPIVPAFNKKLEIDYDDDTVSV